MRSLLEANKEYTAQGILDMISSVGVSVAW